MPPTATAARSRSSVPPPRERPASPRRGAGSSSLGRASRARRCRRRPSSYRAGTDARRHRRPRIIAMAIDVVVMVVILFGVQNLVGDRLVERWYPHEHAQLTAITDDPAGDDKSQIEEAKDKADASDEAADEAEDDRRRRRGRAPRPGGRRQGRLRRARTTRSRTCRGKVAPGRHRRARGHPARVLRSTSSSRARSAGRRSASASQKIRVVRQDGRTARAGAARSYRYGLIILATNAADVDPALRAARYRDRLLRRAGLDAQPEPPGSARPRREDDRRRRDSTTNDCRRTVMAASRNTSTPSKRARRSRSTCSAARAPTSPR